MKRGIVNPDLLEERQKCAFDQDELTRFIVGEDVVQEMHDLIDFIRKEPKMQVELKFLEEDRNQQMTHWWRIIHTLYSNPIFKKKFFTGNSAKNQLRFCWSYLFNGTSPLHLHQTMFTKSISFLGNKEQNERWIPLANDLHIIGCYV